MVPKTECIVCLSSWIFFFLFFPLCFKTEIMKVFVFVKKIMNWKESQPLVHFKLICRIPQLQGNGEMFLF